MGDDETGMKGHRVDVCALQTLGKLLGEEDVHELGVSVGILTVPGRLLGVGEVVKIQGILGHLVRQGGDIDDAGRRRGAG